MISIINEQDASARKSVSKRLIKDSIAVGMEIVYDSNFDFTMLLRRDASRIMFNEYPRSEKKLKEVRDFAIQMIINEESRFTEEEKVFARLFIFNLERGGSVRKFFLHNTKDANALNRVLLAVRNNYIFNPKEDEELV